MIEHVKQNGFKVYSRHLSTSRMSARQILSLVRTGSLFHFAFIKLKASDTMATEKQTQEMIAVAQKGPLEGLNAPAFELGKIQN